MGFVNDYYIEDMKEENLNLYGKWVRYIIYLYEVLVELWLLGNYDSRFLLIFVFEF